MNVRARLERLESLLPEPPGLNKLDSNQLMTLLAELTHDEFIEATICHTAGKAIPLEILIQLTDGLKRLRERDEKQRKKID